MRCITRIINDNLNTGKHAGVLSLFDRYHDEKTYWLGQFAKKENRVYIKL